MQEFTTRSSHPSGRSSLSLSESGAEAGGTSLFIDESGGADGVGAAKGGDAAS